MKKRKFTELDWWKVYAILAFLPILLSTVAGTFFYGFLVSIGMTILSGEVILSSSIVALTATLNCYRKRKKSNDLIFVVLLVLTMFQMLVYTGVKLANIYTWAVGLLSAVFAILSVLFAYASEKAIIGGKKL